MSSGDSCSRPLPRPTSPKVVIVTASMGGGHNGAAAELDRRVRDRGGRTATIEFLDAQPLGIGWAVRRAFRWVLNRAPFVYEWGYRSCVIVPVLFGPLVWLDCVLSARRLRRMVLSESPDVVVSTYPLSSLVLGRERRAGRIEVPVVTFLTDFSVHPLWVHPGIDLHLAVCSGAAGRAHELGDGLSVNAGTLVSPRFRAPRIDRWARRAELGVRPGERVALVVAGSWGVGDVEQTLRDIESDGSVRTVTVCGDDERLRSRLAAHPGRIVLGWTDDMPGLMAAADVLVENAGGLTALEAMTAGLPVITYRPIAGHGRDNAAAMADAGVTRYVESPTALRQALLELSSPGVERDRALERADEVVQGDPTAHVLALVSSENDDRVVDLRNRSSMRLHPSRSPRRARA